MEMFNAHKARLKTNRASLKRFKKAIKYAIKQGDQLCFVRLRASESEISFFLSLGYEVRVDSAGVTWFYWR